MTEARAPTIYVDADACPVKDEVLRVAARHGVLSVFVSNGGIRPSRDPLVRTVVVGQGADAADDWIAEQVRERDIVVTADVPLAARALEKGAAALGPTGRPFTEATIGMALAMRDLNRHLRETGESRGLNRAFAPRDRSAFLEALELALRRAMAG